MHCVDLGESSPTSIFLQNFVSIQPRTSPVEFAAPRTRSPAAAWAERRRATSARWAGGVSVCSLLSGCSSQINNSIHLHSHFLIFHVFNIFKCFLPDATQIIHMISFLNFEKDFQNDVSKTFCGISADLPELLSILQLSWQHYYRIA